MIFTIWETEKVSRFMFQSKTRFVTNILNITYTYWKVHEKQKKSKDIWLLIKTIPWSSHIFQIKWEIHLFYTIFFRQNAPQRTWLNNFQNKFWTSGSAHARKPVLLLSCLFWFGHFRRSKLDSKPVFLIGSYINPNLKFLKHFVVKNGV